MMQRTMVRFSLLIFLESVAEETTGSTEACSFLTVQANDVAEACDLKPIVTETIDGQLAKLPG